MKKSILPLLILMVITTVTAHAQSWELVGARQFSSVTSGNSQDRTSIAIDANGTPYVTYGRNSSSNSPVLRASVMKFNGTNWVVVGNANFSANSAVYPSITLNSSGVPYVVYYNYGNSSPRQAGAKRYNSGTNTWVPVSSAELFSGVTAAFTTSAMDQITNTLYALYYNPNTKLTVMKNVNNSSNWIAVGSEFGIASGNQNITVDPADGTPYVIYMDKSQNGSKACVVKYNGSSWVSVGALDFSAGAIFQSSIKIYNGTPYVAYSDGGNSSKATVMKFDGTNWVRWSGKLGQKNTNN